MYEYTLYLYSAITRRLTYAPNERNKFNTIIAAKAFPPSASAFRLPDHRSLCEFSRFVLEGRVYHEIRDIINQEGRPSHWFIYDAMERAGSPDYLQFVRTMDRLRRARDTCPRGRHRFCDIRNRMIRELGLHVGENFSNYTLCHKISGPTVQLRQALIWIVGEP
ncbi:hypothetical protein V8E54_000406 [Elaphomyces granulatus]